MKSKMRKTKRNSDLYYKVDKDHNDSKQVNSHHT